MVRVNVMKEESFCYSGKNISVSVHWESEGIHFTILKINPEQQNGDIFFMENLFIDHDELRFGYLGLPYVSMNATPKKPFAFRFHNISKPVFEMLCEAIKYYDIHTQNQIEETI